MLIWSQNGRFMDWRAPDGDWFKIELAPASNIPGEETPCLFRGKPVADEDSRVAVSGCQGDKEVAVTIASRKISVVDLVISLKSDLWTPR